MRLKTQRASETGSARGQAGAPDRYRIWSPGRHHVLAEFSQDVTAAEIAGLAADGVRFIQYVPDNGFILSVPEGVRPEGPGLVRAERLRAEEKLSHALKDESHAAAPGHLLVEFHQDVDPQVARLIAEDVGYQVVDHQDLLPNHLLLHGRQEDAALLAEWDEVAYVFPASGELAAGEHVAACPGALTAAGYVGQYVATVGDGWDGPGLGSAHLGYHFERLTDRLPPNRVREEVLRALGEWSRVAGVSFYEAVSPTALRTLNFLFARGDHGDGYPFDGPGRVLAHTFYPSPPNPESIAGDVHLDDDEEWVIGPDISVRSVDLFSVSLHEVGHALGLGHSDLPGSVMYPYYRRATALTQEDSNAIRRLYAAPGETPVPQPPAAAPLTLSITAPPAFPLTTAAATLAVSGSATGGSGDVLVAWTSDRAGAGVAQGGRTWSIPSLPLQPGSNTVTITAADAASARTSRVFVVTRQAAAEKPALTIQSPTTGSSHTTQSATVALTGTASPASGIVRVEWASSRGFAGLAAGTASWSTGPVPLQPGENRITVTATDAHGESAYRVLIVSCAPAADTVAPTVRITSPAATSVLVTSPTIRIQGTATDNVGVTQVAWSTSSNRTGVAAGTSSWNTGEIPLLVGTNTVVVRAHDAAGNSGWRSITVTRK